MNATPGSPHNVRIHIDQRPYESPRDTTGEALYALGHVQEGLTLYREVSGNREDPAIVRDHEPVHVRDDEHFHSGATAFFIIVNGEKKEVSKNVLTFAEIVHLAFPNPPSGPNVVFTVTYKKAAHNRQGSLAEGETVHIKNGTIFNVTATDKS